jgi:hypothetical protein
MATAKKQTPKARSTVATPVVIDGSVKRKGLHAKRGTSRLKTSKNYKKAYRGQGRSR